MDRNGDPFVLLSDPSHQFGQMGFRLSQGTELRHSHKYDHKFAQCPSPSGSDRVGA